MVVCFRFQAGFLYLLSISYRDGQRLQAQRAEDLGATEAYVITHKNIIFNLKMLLQLGLLKDNIHLDETHAGPCSC